MANILDEYLVALGFQIDTTGYARFAAALRDASSLADNVYLDMTKKVLEFQVAAVGAFVAVGVAALGIADKTAMADQEYRLLALHMYTTLPVARELKVALDALGQPLENVMWDPELSRRFHELVEDQKAMTEQLGPGFEAEMLKIRDVRFEFTRFGVELQYLTMYVVEDFAKLFGTNIDGLLGKMQDFNSWFIKNMPEIAKWLTTSLTPALRDTYRVLESTWEVVKALGGAFTNLVSVLGVLNGDPALQGTGFDKFATALQRVLGFITDVIVGLSRTEMVLLHLLNAGEDLSVGNWKGAKAEFGAASGVVQQRLNTNDLSDTQQTIAAVAQQFGIPPELALAVAKIESNFQQYDSSGHVLTSKAPGSHAMGIFQLQPGTARDMGVDATTPWGNILGGVKYLALMLKKYKGNVAAALEAYAGGTPGYASKVMQAEGDMSISVQVNVATNANPHQIAAATVDAIAKSLRNKTQRNLAEFQGPGWSY